MSEIHPDHGRLQALMDREQIRDVIARNLYGMDKRDWDMVRSCYHEDATEAHGDLHDGPATALIEWVENEAPREFASWTHMAAQTMIDLDGDRAQAETYVVGIHQTHPDESGRVKDVFKVGRYISQFERRHGEWKIASRETVIDWGPVERG